MKHYSLETEYGAADELFTTKMTRCAEQYCKENNIVYEYTEE